MESPVFFILLFAHLGFLILGFGSVIVTDLYGLLWMWNRVRFKQIINLSGVTTTFIWTGWIGMVAVGIPLIILKGEIDNLMLIKIAFVILIGLNGIPLHFIQKKLHKYTDDVVVPGIFIFRLMLAVTVSQIGWWGAIIIGFLHRHVWSIIEWPDQPWLYIGLFTGALVTIWMIGEVFFKQKEGESYIDT